MPPPELPHRAILAHHGAFSVGALLLRHPAAPPPLRRGEGRLGFHPSAAVPLFCAQSALLRGLRAVSDSLSKRY